jgi:hypothetical protein
MNLTKEQVEQMELPEVKKRLKQLQKEYPFDQPLTEITDSALLDSIDDIANTYLYLDDRRAWLEQYGHLRGEEKV